MKLNCARCASLAIMLAALTTTGWCQDTGLPSLFPLPPMPPIGSGYPISQTAATDAVWGPNELSPVQTGPIQTPVQGTFKGQGPEVIQTPMPGSVQIPNQSLTSPDYAGAMKGDYGGYSSVGSPCGGSTCCHNHYIYANALAMTRAQGCGTVLSVDDVTGAERLCTTCAGRNVYAGGFEIGTGWCFGGGSCCGSACGSCCNCNAIELVYWGVFPATKCINSIDDMNSTINFGDLTYNGGSANVPFNSAEFQQVCRHYNFNSVEANLVGNCGCGPFGCGMCGCCCGGSCRRIGFGYVAGFRYMNFSDYLLYSSSLNGFSMTGTDPNEINYAVATNNNLFGFQLGGGLSYCVCNRLTAFAISKFGVYDNHITALQKVYGPAGTAVIANGVNAGQPFDVRSTGFDALALGGQFDVGARWMVTNNWTANFGYRVLGLSGVATTDNNIKQQNFHDVDGIATVQRCGSFVLHGLFAGATYCF
jgi:opacity protein-like surface antigen